MTGAGLRDMQHPLQIVSEGTEESMIEAAKRVFYVKYLAHQQEYERIFAARPDVRLDRLEIDSADEVAAPILAGAHAYQAGSSRDEIPQRFHATRDLLRREIGRASCRERV